VGNQLVKENLVVKESRTVEVHPQAKVNLALKRNPGKENPTLAERENPKASRGETATRNPNKTPIAKKLPSSGAVENNSLDRAN
tara:strand:- start:4011 stop:4262 length:252 start_codon:yes stop_codon:yes gene_type:complete